MMLMGRWCRPSFKSFFVRAPSRLRRCSGSFIGRVGEHQVCLRLILLILLLTANEETKYEYIRFRTTILDTITAIGEFSASTYSSCRTFDQEIVFRLSLSLTRCQILNAAASITRSFSRSPPPQPRSARPLRDLPYE